MNIYRISQSKNQQYDSYDSAVVIAANEDQAKMIHPNGNNIQWNKGKLIIKILEDDRSWVINPNYIQVELIGKAKTQEKKPRVICASFNAG